MKILVTGGAGYIGSALMPLLNNAVILDNFSLSRPYNLFGQLKNKIIVGDITKKEDINKATKEIDTIIHLAALTGAETLTYKEKTKKVNVDGTKNLLEATRKNNVKKFIFTSSCNIYGTKEERKLTEKDIPNPINNYAVSKYKAEKLCEKYEKEYGISTVCLRLSTNYGYSLGIRHNLVINKFVFNALINEPLIIYGNGNNWRPFIHVKDTAKAILFFINNKYKGIYNVGDNSENYQIKDIISCIKNNVNKNIEVIYQKEENKGPSYNVCFDKLKKTGFKLNYNLEQGVKELVNKFKNGY